VGNKEVSGRIFCFGAGGYGDCAPAGFRDIAFAPQTSALGQGPLRVLGLGSEAPRN